MENESKMDIDLHVENHHFRYRACAIIIENGAVLMKKYKPENYFYSIGGGVKMGETTEEACEREVFEETGVPYKVERLAFIHENFFPEHLAEKPQMHELAFYFVMKVRAHGELVPEEPDDLQWLPLADFAKYKAFPTFFAEELPKLEQKSNDIKTIVTHE